MQQEISTIIQEQKQYFLSRATQNLTARIHLLSLLEKTIKKYENEIINALFLDLNKCQEEAYMSELIQVYEEIKAAKKWIKTISKPKIVKTPLSHFGGKSKIYYDPYGVVLIISPWNYPINLSLNPLIGAIACGNCVVLKPSEYAPNCARILEKILQEVFSNNHVAVIQGDSEIGAKLLEQKFDYIFFTGSVNIGRIVMQEAAKNLTPISLELGGKNPCIVEDSTNLKITAKRIIWGKLLNTGQTCIAPDYLLIKEDLKDAIISELINAIVSLYAPNAQDIIPAILSNQEYGKIISLRHFKRIESLLNNTITNLEEECIIFGGILEESKLKISPTLINMGDINTYLEAQKNNDALCKLNILNEEIFAPILPIFTYKNLEECKTFIQGFEKPLALYLFSNNKDKQNHIINTLSFGGGCINDCIMQVANNHLPFGGVGNSGIGNYHGKYSAKTFAREKSIYQAPFFDMPLRYPPFKKKIFGFEKIKTLKKIFEV